MARRLTFVRFHVHSALGRFRVLVTDGLHTGYEDSDGVFSVPNRIPSATIVQPSEAVTIATGQTLTLDGEAYDIDTGTMPAQRLQWISSLDGVLGTGASLPIAPLSVGTHTITFQADDGEGGVGTDTVQVTVVANLGQLPPPADALIAAPSLLTLDPAAGRPSATLSVENANPDRSISWQAVPSTPWAQLSASSGSTPARISVTFDATGLPAGRNSASITLSTSGGDPIHIGVEAIVQGWTGDCGGDGEVTVNELLSMVNVALDLADVTSCPPGDANRDGQVTINEILIAVNNALKGCAPS